MNKSTKDVWVEAWRLVQQWEKITGEIRDILSRDELGSLSSLLDQRGEITEKLDNLKDQYGITSWGRGSAPNDSPTLAMLKDELASKLRELVAEDQLINEQLQLKMNSLKEEIQHLHKSKAAQSAYLGPPGSQPSGAFIDTKK